MLVAIVACEVGFWIFLGAGLLLRYGLDRPRAGGASSWPCRRSTWHCSHSPPWTCGREPNRTSRTAWLGVLAAAISTAVLVGLASSTGPGVDDGPLLGFVPESGFVLVIRLLGWPVSETVRLAASPDRARTTS